MRFKHHELFMGYIYKLSVDNGQTQRHMVLDLQLVESLWVSLVLPVRQHYSLSYWLNSAVNSH